MKSKPTAGEVLHNITRLAHEAEWTEEEVNEALREEGIDPDALVRDVMARLRAEGVRLPMGEKPADVFARPECLFNYCPREGDCQERCQHPATRGPLRATPTKQDDVVLASLKRKAS